MKRRVVLLIAILCLAAMTFSFVSCGETTLLDFKKRLGNDYEVSIYKGDSDMQKLLENFEIDIEEFEVAGVLHGEHKTEEQYIGIIECESKDAAAKVQKTLADLFEELGWKGSSYMQLTSDIRRSLSVATANGQYIENGEYTLSPSENALQLVRDWRFAERYTADNFTQNK